MEDSVGNSPAHLRARGRAVVVLVSAAVLVGAVPGACSASNSAKRQPGAGGSAGGQSDSSTAGSGGTGATGGTTTTDGAAGQGGSGAALLDVNIPDADLDATIILPDPETCEEAEAQESYAGCDFWPTVTTNPVWSIFDFTVVVANAGTQPADVTVTHSGMPVATETLAPNALVPIYLPWVPALKGPDSDTCASATPPTASNRVDDGAFHLTSTRPITVYQFSALEYQGAGGPPGKDWSSCPGNQGCPLTLNLPVGCFAFSNDASLLLPSTAMTGNYRVATMTGWAAENVPSYVAVTATEDGTTVDVQVSSTGQIVGGTGITATPAGGVLTLSMDAGDVVQLLSGTADDLSGSLVQADKPVQVLTGMSCVQLPNAVAACDHIEESMLPAESLGKHYFVTRPTGPAGQPVGQIVRVFGNVDGTQLSYPSGTPVGAPALVNAGQVFDMGVVDMDFEIVGDHEFSVATFQLGGASVDPAALPGTRKGDPSQSQSVAVEQYRTRYIFIAPVDYLASYVDVVTPMGASIILDGSPLPIAPVPIGSSSHGVARVQLGTASGGVHLIHGDQPFGIQVVGYGTNTSYQYPGGLSTRGIAPPPPPVK